MPRENNDMTVGQEFIKELRESLATESKKAKWQRSVDAQMYPKQINNIRVAKQFIYDRYIKDE